MSKSTQGQKIHKHERIRNNVFKWIIEEPSITDYSISMKLKDEFNFKASQPSVASWRANYFPQMLADHEKSVQELSKPVAEKIDLKLMSIVTLNKYIEDFSKRLEMLAMILPDYHVDPNSQTTGVRYVSGNEVELEERYQTNAKFVVDLIKERDKLVGGWTPYDVALDTAQKITEMVALYLKVDAQSEEYKAFKEALLQLDSSLKERYNVKK